MVNVNKAENNGKPRAKVSIFHILLILIGADMILLLAPEVGILNSLWYIRAIYSWPSLFGGLVLLVLGFRGFIKKL